jgi:hypothetical protein
MRIRRCFGYLQVAIAGDIHTRSAFVLILKRNFGILIQLEDLPTQEIRVCVGQGMKREMNMVGRYRFDPLTERCDRIGNITDENRGSVSKRNVRCHSILLSQSPLTAPALKTTKAQNACSSAWSGAAQKRCGPVVASTSSSSYTEGLKITNSENCFWFEIRRVLGIL